MAQAVLNSASAGYSISGGAPTGILTIPATTPAVGRASIYFVFQSSAAWNPFTVGYSLTFTPNTGASITQDITPFAIPITALGGTTYLVGRTTVEDVSGNPVDSVASGGVLSMTSHDADTGVVAALVLQADSPPGFQMRTVGLGSFPASDPPPSVTSNTIGAINKDTGPFLTILGFSAVHGGNSPSFTPSDPSIVLTPVIDVAANSAVIALKSYVSPANWGWTTEFWYLLPPGFPSFTINAAWTGATFAYSGGTSTIVHSPIPGSVVSAHATRSLAQVIG